MGKKYMWNGIVCIVLVLFIIVFYKWYVPGAILFSVVLGFYMCLVADDVFTDRLIEDKTE